MSAQGSICCIALLLLSCLLSVQVQAEFYSSADKVQELDKVEKQLVAATQLFLEEQQQQLDVFRSFLEQVKREHVVAKERENEYWEHPLQAFRLQKRVVEDWESIHQLIKANEPKQSYRQMVDVATKKSGLPQIADLQGTVRGLQRLQKIYNLTAVEMANGYLYEVNTGAVLVWSDCFEIGVQLYEEADYSRALDWLVLASNMLEEIEGDDLMEPSSQVYEYLALTHFELGEKKRAQKILADLRDWDVAQSSQHTASYLDHTMPKCPQPANEMKWFHNYTQLCQGKLLPREEEKKSARKASPLRCYHDAERHVIFKLAPLRVEEVHRDPDVYVFHNVLTDGHIASIFKVADEITKFRSSVQGGIVSDIRVSQQVWLNYTSPIMRSVSQLVGAISGYNMSNAEEMQVANYGVGGQYVPHLDAMSVLPPDFKLRGNRISTNMFYLSDVLQGGYTVFPELNLFLKPIKGALVMWHNLFRSLRPHPRTLHAGCPVIEGSKRIGNIWIHTVHQEFQRPCTLNKDE